VFHCFKRFGDHVVRLALWRDSLTNEGIVVAAVRHDAVNGGSPLNYIADTGDRRDIFQHVRLERLSAKRLLLFTCREALLLWGARVGDPCTLTTLVFGVDPKRRSKTTLCLLHPPLPRSHHGCAAAIHKWSISPSRIPHNNPRPPAVFLYPTPPSTSCLLA
jgi:hypothetical protein